MRIHAHESEGYKKIITDVTVIRCIGPFALCRIGLITGRTHQIRAHLAHLGYPICGDDRYGAREKNKRWKVTRQQLWSTRIEFTFKHGTPLAYLDGRKFSVSPEFTLNA